jgi:hypothetical protein
MNMRAWMKWVAVCLVAGATNGFSAVYYIDDDSNAGDIWTPGVTGNDAFDGTLPTTPKRTLANLISTTTLNPGDIVYIDTGTYASGTVISNTVNGVTFQGSTVPGGTVFSGTGTQLTVAGVSNRLMDVTLIGGTGGLGLSGARQCEFIRVRAISNTTPVVNNGNPSSNAFRNCVFAAGGNGSNFDRFTWGSDNYIEYSILWPNNGNSLSVHPTTFSNIVGCVIGGTRAFLAGYTPPTGTRNVFFYSGSVAPDIDTLSDLQREYPGWTHNTFADPLFVNPTGLDFHVLSAAGFVSNGVWVTNAAVGYSPLIDFGPPANPGFAAEPEPNGGRINIGLHGGTAEASKSRTNAWLYAMTFNDGGTLMRTGRLEWVAATNLAGATVDLQYTTNSGVSWTDIATGVPATNEHYTWIPDISHPAARWRVLNGVHGIASTNARVFSIRTNTNVTFSFYVNDGSTNRDVYCSATGTNAADGLRPSTPKRSLQAILDTYQLRGGDTIYVDTGNYATNFTTTIATFDGGSPGNPVRILGSPNGSLFARASTSADAMEINSAGHLELENLQLTDGRYGLYVNLSSNLTMRNIQFTGNRYGVTLNGAASLLVFDRCQALDNTIQGFSGNSTQARTNLWQNGLIWGSPTLVHSRSNALTIDNSILGNGTALFGLHVTPGDHNLVWQAAVGLSYETFTILQDAGFGWRRSLYADPLFANSTNRDFHLKSVMGRYSTNTQTFVTNDLVHSPAIDLGDPALPVGDEPEPNGARLNAGLFGGTAQASKSRTNEWLLVTSYRDGGTLDAQAGAWLRWNGGGYPTNSTVTIWLSRDNGASWTNVAVQTATNGAYWYQNTATNDPSSPLALWRVTLDGSSSPDATSVSPTNFSYKNGIFTFYVNDSSTNNDVYCTAIGSDTNVGLSAATPMASLAALVDRYKLGPGDQVYVDTGVYSFPATPVTLTSQDSGTNGAPVRILGSTNRLAGGTQFGQAAGTTMGLAFDFRSGASNIVLKDIVVTNVFRGITVSNSANIVFENVEVRGGRTRAFDVAVGSRDIELLRCVAQGGGVGVHVQQATNVAIRHSVFWQNQTNAIYLGTATTNLILRNSVLASSNANAVLISTPATNTFSSDYNGLHAGPNTRVGANRTTGIAADNLAAWQALSGQDARSIPGDPQFADPGAYDYHLKTEQTLGRRLPNGLRTSDSVSSPLLDAGDPASDASAEPEPNGDRVNIGLFGGTAEASIALTPPWLRAVSYGDAGAVRDGTVSLRWIAGGGFSNQTVKVEVSVDGGTTWGTTVATGIPATNGVVEWTVAGLPDTPAATWRVAGETTNVSSRSPVFFSIRNAALDLYVNGRPDASAAIYSTAGGQASNWMATASAPLDSLVAVFENFDLEPGDKIWVDPATYTESRAIQIGLKNSGTSNNPVRVTGDPLAPFTGVVLARGNRATGAFGIQMAYAGGVKLSDLAVSNAWTGIQMENCNLVSLERVRVGYTVTNALFAGAATRVELANSIVEQSLSTGLQAMTGAVVKVNACLFRDHTRFGVHLRGGDVEVKNSILEANGTQGHIYYLAGNSTLASDYNNIRATEGAHVAGGDNRLPDRFLYNWSTNSANDRFSSGYAADFANPAALDFHLKSEFGRYDPIAMGYVTNDSVTSKLIDLGVPVPGAYSDFANEPAPNGGRVNVGLYGNTVQASKSSGGYSLVPLTMSDGGSVQGTVQLYWAWNGFIGSETVIVQFSPDGGQTWMDISTNAFVNTGTVTWNTTNYPSTAMGAWRVMTTNEPPTIGATETLFAVANNPLAYYVNDASTNGDVYCTAIGISTNNGTTPGTPMDSLSRLLGRYGMNPGDTIYVDTGVYPRNSSLVLAPTFGATTNWLVIQGSTNEAAGGTVFSNSAGSVIELQNARSLELRDLRLAGGDRGLLLTKSSSNRLIRLRSTGAAVNAFELGTESDQNRFIQCAALNFMRTGIHVMPPAGAVAATTNHWTRGVIASVAATSNGTAVSTGALVGVRSGRLNISNSVLVAAGPAHVVYAAGASAVRGNYNAYHRVFTNSIFAEVVGSSPVFGLNTIYMAYLGDWRDWNQSDGDSLAGDPLFADLAGGDLHPKSQGGRYSPELGDFVLDDETSPLIDTADPALDASAETAPNGGRANLGIYGGTEFASRTTSDGPFVLLTLNQGGVARGTNTLKWHARGGATNAGHGVFIQLSTNSGVNWQTIGTNLAGAGAHAWNSTTNPSLPTARWRVQSRTNAAWAVASERDFLIHNSNLTYYVNDSFDPATDMYCAAAGSTNHTGLTPDSPLPSLADVLARYDLEPGDEVLIDTGTYTAPAALGYLDCGEAGNPVRITGSTVHPGTVFLSSRVQVENVRGVALRNLKFNTQSGSPTALQITWAEDVSVDHLDILGPFANGVAIQTSSNVLLRNFSVAYTMTNGVASIGSFNTRFEFGTIWSNGVAQVLARNQVPGSSLTAREASFAMVSNCVMGAFGIRKPVYEVRGNLHPDFNNLFLANGALAALSYEGGFGREFDSVGNWTTATGKDSQSLSHPPRFADAVLGDFHLRSSAGRYDPVLGAHVFTDPAAEDSPLIDAGDPALACTEPEPNGGRVNIGRYGNTAQASLTPTNGVLTLISFNDGGKASGTVWIRWLARGEATNDLVTISYSPDGGLTWIVLATGVSAAAGEWSWNTVGYPETVEGKLKIESEGPSGAPAAISSGLFSVRNGTFSFYINDDYDPVNDVYCTAAGNNLNSGLTPDKPMADLNTLLARYDLESGDIVYIDTGVYRGLNPWRITQADSAGDLDIPPVVFQGSTNYLANGTVLERNFNAVGIQVDYAVGVRLRDLSISNATGNAVVFNECYDVAAESVTVGGSDVGFYLNLGNRLRVANSRVFTTAQGVGVMTTTPDTNTVPAVIENNVIWRSTGPAIKIDGQGGATVRNNILSTMPGQYIYELGANANLAADYNSIWQPDGGRVVRKSQTLAVSPVPIVYETVGAWSAASRQDLHTYDGDPLLADSTNRNFHLKSRAGRWVPATGSWTNDLVSSPLIDAGWPGSGWENEPAPNGSRINIGNHGGTPFASKSSTNSALQLLTLNRGGVASGQIALNWQASGLATGHTVRLEATIDGGANWFLIASGLEATLGGITWNSGDLVLAAWPCGGSRIEDEPGVEAASELPFVLHNSDPFPIM